MNKYTDGKVFVNNTELKVSYKHTINDEIFCICLENKNNFIIGQTFYTHYKSIINE